MGTVHYPYPQEVDNLESVLRAPEKQFESEVWKKKYNNLKHNSLGISLYPKNRYWLLINTETAVEGSVFWPKNK